MAKAKCRFGTSEKGILLGLLNVARDIDAKLDYLISDRDERRVRTLGLGPSRGPGFPEHPER